mmetsp:Transcript_19347/g.23106  ORF Transcript_19347/g.23106 Transcript_19347/m.23106 type:complete len:93 (-) Transcript_19347:481-759(-)|eukprot:CAMPEP_0197847576 /NCGR_PEP_ID=MMETSP1438-20131217/6456_1 /TAXON_ID=1461541 /ORGANISM="Pterosperma sp., Strain CCMP1384" /LENGTH=92 /DNA_ID=CAMNT_0043459535 /DNA_START=80 /DNA_END=358 /DNA_ORIENTATION=-
MELFQQVKNSHTTALMASSSYKVNQQLGKTATSTPPEHVNALQKLSNGQTVAYANTLRIVTHEGDRAPVQEPTETRKHPGYIRNELGGTFTS